MFLKFLRVQWDRVAACVSLAGGLAALLLGWNGVSGTSKTYEQIPYLVSGGLLGLYLLGLGAMLWLSGDARDEWRKLDTIEQLQRSAGPVPERMPGRPANSIGSDDAAEAGGCGPDRSGPYRSQPART